MNVRSFFMNVRNCDKIVQHNKEYHRKALSFHLNDDTSGFHPQTQKLQPPCTA